jgi:hypothetical protein
MPDAMRSLNTALRIWGGSSPRSFVTHLFPIIRSAASIDWILSHLSPTQRAGVTQHLYATYGEHTGPVEGFDWGSPGRVVVGRKRAAEAPRSVGGTQPPRGYPRNSRLAQGASCGGSMSRSGRRVGGRDARKPLPGGFDQASGENENTPG